jgi:hypothetical protein
MSEFASVVTLACDGCFKGYPAVISLVLIVALLIGSIWMLLWSNLGARVSYLVTMVSLGAFMVTMSLIWLIGAPGTTTATGPRGREPAWVPFTPDSPQGDQFREVVDSFPDGEGWVEPGPIFPGQIDSSGEVQAVTSAIQHALANQSLVSELEPGETYTERELEDEIDAWDFRRPGEEALTAAQERIPEADGLKFYQSDTPLLFGVTIPATDDHPERTVLAYRDKGLVYLYSLYFLIASLAIFVLHLWLLGRHELRKKDEDERMETRTPVSV